MNHTPSLKNKRRTFWKAHLWRIFVPYEFRLNKFSHNPHIIPFGMKDRQNIWRFFLFVVMIKNQVIFMNKEAVALDFQNSVVRNSSAFGKGFQYFCFFPLAWAGFLFHFYLEKSIFLIYLRQYKTRRRGGLRRAEL